MAILRTLWRHKIASGLLIVLTLAGCVGVLFTVPPTYTASGSYLLIRPPDSTDEPAVTGTSTGSRSGTGTGTSTGSTTKTRTTLRTDNPYLRFSDQSVVPNVLARKVMEDTNAKKLVAEGADPRFEAAPSNKFGFASPIIEVTSTANTAESAIKTVEIVGKSVVTQLRAMQDAESVDPRFMYKSQVVESPDQATRKSSGVLRTLLGVAGLGGILLMLMVAVFQIRDRKKYLAEHPELAAAVAAAAPPPFDVAPVAASGYMGPSVPASPPRPAEPWVETPPRSPAPAPRLTLRPEARSEPRSGARPEARPERRPSDRQDGRAPMAPQPSGNAPYRNGAPRSDSNHSGTGQNGSNHNGAGQNGSGQNGQNGRNGREGSGQNGFPAPGPPPARGVRPAARQQRFVAPDRSGQNGQNSGPRPQSGVPGPSRQQPADAWPAVGPRGAGPTGPGGRPAQRVGRPGNGYPADGQNGYAADGQSADPARRGPRTRIEPPNPHGVRRDGLGRELPAHPAEEN